MTTPIMLLRTVRHLILPGLVVLLLLMPLLSYGGDGAEQPLSPQRSPSPAMPSRISGHVMVPPHDTIAGDPNNTDGPVQMLSSISTVFGRAT